MCSLFSLLLVGCLFLVSIVNATPVWAFFSDQTTISNNSIQTGDWTGSRSEAGDNLADYTPVREFTIEYLAWDEYSNVAQVSLWYNYNDSGWRLFASQAVTGQDVAGQFEFTSPFGDGLYDFIVTSQDEFGNQEDSDDDGVADIDDLDFIMAEITTIVDTTPPSTFLSLGEFGSFRQNTGQLIDNPGFETGTGTWQAGGDGDHTTTTDQSVSGIQSFQLGFCQDPGGYPIGTDYLEQTIDLDGQLMATLSFWYRFYSEDLVDWDYFTVHLQDPAGIKPDSQVVFYGRETGNLGEGEMTDWIEITYPLDSWLGQRVNLRFEVKNSLYAGDNTCVYLDDVRIDTANNYLAYGETIDVTATDASGSGVLSTECQLNEGDWLEVDGPVDVGDSGSYTVRCRSTDYEANQSETETLEIVVDDTAPIGIVIDQLMPDPLGPDNDPMPNGEWLELYNNTNRDLDLTGWYLTDAGGSRLDLTTERSATGSLLLTAGGYLHFYRRVDPATAIGFELTNAGDTISLFTAAGELADRVTYTPTIAEGKTWLRDPSGSTNWVDPAPVDRFAPPAAVIITPTVTTTPAPASELKTDSATPSSSLTSESTATPTPLADQTPRSDPPGSVPTISLLLPSTTPTPADPTIPTQSVTHPADHPPVAVPTEPTPPPPPADPPPIDQLPDQLEPSPEPSPPNTDPAPVADTQPTTKPDET